MPEPPVAARIPEEGTAMTDQHEQDLTPERVIELMRGERFVMLSSVTADGKIVSHPMTPLDVTAEADTWFITSSTSGLYETFVEGAEVNLSFAETGSWLSVSGRIRVVDDRAKLEDLWNDRIGVYFEDGIDDPTVRLLRVDGESAQFWGSPGGRAGALLDLVAARLKGERPSGTSGTTEL